MGHRSPEKFATSRSQQNILWKNWTHKIQLFETQLFIHYLFFQVGETCVQKRTALDFLSRQPEIWFESTTSSLPTSFIQFQSSLPNVTVRVRIVNMDVFAIYNHIYIYFLDPQIPLPPSELRSAPSWRPSCEGRPGGDDFRGHWQKIHGIDDYLCVFCTCFASQIEGFPDLLFLQTVLGLSDMIHIVSTWMKQIYKYCRNSPLLFQQIYLQHMLYLKTLVTLPATMSGGAYDDSAKGPPRYKELFPIDSPNVNGWVLMKIHRKPQQDFPVVSCRFTPGWSAFGKALPAALTKAWLCGAGHDAGFISRKICHLGFTMKSPHRQIYPTLLYPTLLYSASLRCP